MAKPFADHFAPVASNYADFRPTYPDALFAWLASVAPARELAWDCACGSGQASVDLARYFNRVVATDASEAQIQAAAPHPRIDYRVATEVSTDLQDHSIDLVTVAQALHWLDLDRFYAEVERVLRHAGVIAVWSYGIHTVGDAAIDAAIHAFYSETVGPYWPPERRHVENGYANLPFPFPRIAAPVFTMTASWPLPQFLGYLRSWSATGRYISKNGLDPVIELAERLRPLWGDAATPRTVTWPLSLRVGRV